MKEYCSTRELAKVVDLPLMILSRFAVKINLQAGSEKPGQKRSLDFFSALALVLALRCSQIASYPYEDRCLFDSIREKLRELGKEAADYAITIDEVKGCITMGKHEDIRNIYYHHGTFFTGWYTVFSIRPFYEKLNHLMNNGPAPQPDAPPEGIKTVGMPLGFIGPVEAAEKMVYERLGVK